MIAINVDTRWIVDGKGVGLRVHRHALLVSFFLFFVLFFGFFSFFSLKRVFIYLLSMGLLTEKGEEEALRRRAKI